MGRLARFIRFFTEEDDGADIGPTSRVSGVSPLTLTNALAKKIKSLIQYGKVSVSGSEITCNNGTLSVGAVGKNLFKYDSSKATTGTTTSETTRAYYPLGFSNCTLSFSAELIDSGSVTTSNINIGKLSNGKLSVVDGFIAPAGITERTEIFGEDEQAVFMTADTSTSSVLLNFPRYNIMVNLGESPLPYEPYQEGIVTTGTAEEVRVTGKNCYKDTFDGWTKPNNYWIYPVALSEGNWILSATLRTGKTAVTGCVVGFARSGTDYASFQNFTFCIGTEGTIRSLNPITIESTDSPTLAFYGTAESFAQIMDAYAIQLELGSTATEYVPYVAPQLATAPNLYAVEDIVDEVDIISGKVTRRTEAVISDGTTPSGRYIGTVGDGSVIIEARETVYEDDAVATFTAEEETPLNLIKAEFSPVQDLHGQDAPYPAGGGKNKLPNSLAETKTENGITVTSDGKGTYRVTGEATAEANITFPLVADYVIPAAINSGGNGCLRLYNTVGNQSVFLLLMKDNTIVDYWTANPVNRIADTYSGMAGKTIDKIGIRVYANTTVDLTLSPMFSEDGTTTGSFAPYSNICPISGWTGVDIERAGENLIPTSVPSNVIAGTFGTGSVITISSASNARVFAIPVPKNTTIFVQKKEGNREGHGLALADTGDIAVGTTIYDAVGFSNAETASFNTGTHGWLVVQSTNLSIAENLFTTAEFMVSIGSARQDYVAPTDETTIPITFRTDTVNQWDEEWEAGYYGTNDGKPATASNQIRTKNSIPVTAGETYRVVSPQNWQVLYYDENDEYLSFKTWSIGTFTVPTGATQIRINFGSSYGSTYNHDISINYPSTETAYHPYLTTVYGGHLRINRDGSVDLVGEETAVHASDLTWTNNASYANTFNGEGLTDRQRRIDGSNANGCYCDTYKWYTSSGVGSSDGGIALANASSGTLLAQTRIYIKDTRFANKDEFVASFSTYDPLIVCPLATPVTYHLPSVEALVAYDGANNVWHSANGKITVALADADVIEQTTPQPLRTSKGTNTLSWTAEVSGKEMLAEYRTSEPQI